MPNHIDTLRAIHTASLEVRRIDDDLAHEAGMDGAYARLLQAARNLDTPAAPAVGPWWCEDNDGRWYRFYEGSEWDEAVYVHPAGWWQIYHHGDGRGVMVSGLGGRDEADASLVRLGMRVTS